MTEAERKELLSATARVLGRARTPKKRASSRKNLVKARKRLAELRKSRRAPEQGFRSAMTPVQDH